MIGYEVPCDVLNQTVRVYGIYTELDPRAGQINDKVLVIGLVGLVNPGVAYSGSVNSWDVVHRRWSYPGGPVLKVHESLGVPLQGDLVY